MSKLFKNSYRIPNENPNPLPYLRQVEKLMNIYSINIIFTTDRPLTENELDLLRYQVFAQVEEPTDEEGNDAEYTTQLLGGKK